MDIGEFLQLKIFLNFFLSLTLFSIASTFFLSLIIFVILKKYYEHIDVINKRNFLIETFLQWKIEYDYLDIPKHVCSPYYVERLFKGFPYELQRTYYYEAENENLRYLLYKLDLVLRKYDLSPIEQVIKSIESEIESKSKMYTIPEQYVVQALQTYEEKYKLLEEKYKSLEENITKKNKLLQETITTKIEQSTLNLK